MKQKESKSFVKIGIIYILSNVIIKGMAFLTTPIFTRLMSQEEIGSFSNISSWANIISIITTLCLYSSISKARYDYDENIEEYMSTIIIIGSFFTLFVWLIIELNIGFFEKIFDMNALYIRSIMLYSLFTPAIQTLSTKYRMYNEYKKVIMLTWITLIVSTFGSLGLTYLMPNKLDGRVIGNYATVAIIDIIFWIYILIKGKKFSTKMCKYACVLSLPLLVHELSAVLLNSSDRIIINQLCGGKDAALYSIACTITMVLTVILSSLNQAWIPWFFDKLENNKLTDIKRIIPKYIIGFTVICIGLMFIGPEMILIFGGKSYIEAIYVIPPICLSIEIQFIYTFYVNIEFFLKKTLYISAATAGATIINIVLNYLMIPLFGYVAAAYTTVIGYLFMLIFHYIICRKTIYKNLLKKRIIVFSSGLCLCVMLISLILYNNNILRLIIIAVIIMIIIVNIIKNRNKLRKFLKEQI